MSASRRIVTICSSVNRVFFMAPSLSEGAILSSVSWPENHTAGQIAIRASAAAVDSCFLISTLLLRELSRNQVSKKTLGRRTASLSDRHSG